MRYAIGSLWGCSEREVHEPHILGYESSPVESSMLAKGKDGTSQVAKICLGLVSMEHDTLHPHPAGGLFSIHPSWPGALVMVHYIHPDDEQEALAEADAWRQQQAEAAPRPKRRKRPPR